MKKYLLFAFIFMVTTISCHNQENSDKKEGQSKPGETLHHAPLATLEMQVKTISKLERELQNDKREVFNPTRAMAVLSLYDNFIANFPTDTTYRPKYIFKSAQIQVSLKNGKRAIALFEQFLKEFPKHRKAGDAAFIVGFTYETLLNDKEKAKQAYQTFVQNYPNHELKNAAIECIRNLNKSNMELVKEFEKNK